MTVLVHEICECGATVPRRIASGAIEVVWCPECKREFSGKRCGVAGCTAEACSDLTTHGHRTPICALHKLGAKVLGLSYGLSRSERSDGLQDGQENLR